MEFISYAVEENRPLCNEAKNPATPPDRVGRPGLYINTNSSDSHTSCSSSESACSFESGYCLSHFSSESSSSQCSDLCSEAESFAGNSTTTAYSRKSSLLARALALSPRGVDENISVDERLDAADSRLKFNRSRSTGSCRASSLDSGAQTMPHRRSFSNFLFYDDKAREVCGVRFLRCRNCRKVFSGSSSQNGDVTAAPGQGASPRRHLFCSGECYISLHAIVHAAQLRKQQEARQLRQRQLQRVQQMQTQREQVARNRPEGP